MITAHEARKKLINKASQSDIIKNILGLIEKAIDDNKLYILYDGNYDDIHVEYLEKNEYEVDYIYCQNNNKTAIKISW